MSSLTDGGVNPGTVADLTRELRCISMRLARFEDVTQDELDAFVAHRQAVLGGTR